MGIRAGWRRLRPSLVLRRFAKQQQHQSQCEWMLTNQRGNPARGLEDIAMADESTAEPRDKPKIITLDRSIVIPALGV
jgi:hypothetical protein